MNKAKINVNGCWIWIDDAGQPCCRPGSLEDTLPQIKQYIDRASEWVDAVEGLQEKWKKEHFTPKQERQIQRLMKLLKYDRDQAITFSREMDL